MAPSASTWYLVKQWVWHCVFCFESPPQGTKQYPGWSYIKCDYRTHHRCVLVLVLWLSIVSDSAGPQFVLLVAASRTKRQWDLVREPPSVKEINQISHPSTKFGLVDLLPVSSWWQWCYEFYTSLDKINVEGKCKSYPNYWLSYHQCFPHFWIPVQPVWFVVYLSSTQTSYQPISTTRKSSRLTRHQKDGSLQLWRNKSCERHPHPNPFESLSVVRYGSLDSHAILRINTH